MEVRDIFVVGGGLMGSGIVQCCIESGFNTTLNHIRAEFVQRGFGGITQRLQSKVTKGKITGEKEAEGLGNLKTSTDLADAKDAAHLFLLELLDSEDRDPQPADLFGHLFRRRRERIRGQVITRPVSKVSGE